jgi:hypothetical protein
MPDLNFVVLQVLQVFHTEGANLRRSTQRTLQHRLRDFEGLRTVTIYYKISPTHTTLPLVTGLNAPPALQRKHYR